MGRLGRCSSVVGLVATGAACSGGGGDSADDADGTFPACSQDSVAAVCMASADELASPSVDVVVEAFRDGRPPSLVGGSCASGGSDPDTVSWTLCQIPVDDGQAVVGQDDVGGLEVRVVGRAAGQGADSDSGGGSGDLGFALPTGRDRIVVLRRPAPSFSIVTADGVEIGSMRTP